MDTTVFDLTMLDDAATATHQAEQAGERLSFGKFTFTGGQYSRWNKDEEKFLEITPAEYKANPRGAKVKYYINVDIQEFNPELSFTYDRALDVGNKDWFKTFVPSLAEVFGQDAVYNEKGRVNEEALATTLRLLHGAYVCVSDVAQQPRKEDKHINANTGEPYRTTKLVAIYGDKEECEQAHLTRYDTRDKSASNGTTLSDDPLFLIRVDTDFIAALKQVSKGKPKPKQDIELLSTLIEWSNLDVVTARPYLDELRALAGL